MNNPSSTKPNSKKINTVLLEKTKHKVYKILDEDQETKTPKLYIQNQKPTQKKKVPLSCSNCKQYVIRNLTTWRSIRTYSEK